MHTWNMFIFISKNACENAAYNSGMFIMFSSVNCSVMKCFRSLFLTCYMSGPVLCAGDISEKEWFGMAEAVHLHGIRKKRVV